MSIAAVILAAGGSQRMGQPKQLLLVDDQPMLARVVETVLAAGLDQVIVVLGAAADQVAPLVAAKPVTVIINPGWPEGLASSLRAGLSAVAPHIEASLFVPGDLPRLQAVTIQAIIARFRATGKAIVLPTYAGRRGNPVLFARWLFPELLALQGDQGGRLLFATHQQDIEVVAVDDKGILLDIDTPDDYNAIKIQKE